MPPALPHILLIVTDQFRRDAFSPTTTPNLHKLSLVSTRFENAYVSTPTCTPARAGLLTGKSPWNHGMLGYNAYVDCLEYPTTLPSVLAGLGYSTYAVGKNHFGTFPNGTAFVDHGYQRMRLYEGLTSRTLDDYQIFFNDTHPGVDPLSTCGLGWNDWKACPYDFGEFVHPTNWTTREALKLLDGFEFDGSPDDRMFLKVSYHRPHSPYDPPKRLFDRHLKRPVDRFVNNSSWDSRYLNTTEMPHAAWHGDPGADAARRSRAGYLANAEYVDEGIGHILNWLELRGVMDDFLIVCTSDHGDMNGDHNLWRKGYPWDASSHILFMIKLPFQNSGVVSDAIVENRDVAVTIYDLLGVMDAVKESDPLINGKSLLGVLRGQMRAVRSCLDLEHSVVYDRRIHWNALVGFRYGALWKYIFNAFDGEEQLFNLSQDPNESHDLAKVQGWEWDLSIWRGEMVEQFWEEGRGEHWIVDGHLVVRNESITLGPRYPCSDGGSDPVHALRGPSKLLGA